MKSRHFIFPLLRFRNYMNKTLALLGRNSFTVISKTTKIVVRENLHTNDISSTSYLPRLVNILCERPLTQILKKKIKEDSRYWTNFRQG